MTQSYPSKKAVVIDIPEVTNFKESFIYNFFVPSERTSDSLSAIDNSISTKLKNGFDQSTIATSLSVYERFIPRYVRLTWKPSIMINPNVNYMPGSDMAHKISIGANIDKIYDEETFAIDDFSTVIFQDTQIDGKLKFYANQFLDNLLRNKGTLDKQYGQIDLTQIMNAKTSDKVTPDFLSELLTNYRDQGVKYLNKENQEILENTLLNTIKTVKTAVQLNKKFIHKALQTTRENPVSIFEDEISNTILDQALTLEQNTIQNNSSTTMSGLDYDIEINKFVNMRVVDSNFYESQSNAIGYIIEKTELLPNGQFIVHPPLIVESPFVGETLDFNVKYGASYQYKIYSVASFDVRSVNVDTSQVIAITFLVRSRPTYSKVITCVESVPPPSPADFNVNWDYFKKKPILVWTFPPNKQQDIKYFQVFRRKTINEPFELLALYDFDNSEIRTELLENDIRGYNNNELNSLIKVTTDTNYIDNEFDQYNSTYIYTVCSVDAHGLSSNYGPQLQISFDKKTNALNKKLISRSGAPKPYPNLYLLEDLFLDTIKVSGAKKMHVYFNPEYLDIYKVKEGKKNYLDFINTNNLNNTGDKSSYQIQMINVDLQKQEIFTISLSDMRKNNT